MMIFFMVPRIWTSQTQDMSSWMIQRQIWKSSRTRQQSLQPAAETQKSSFKSLENSYTKPVILKIEFFTIKDKFQCCYHFSSSIFLRNHMPRVIFKNLGHTACLRHHQSVVFRWNWQVDQGNRRGDSSFVLIWKWLLSYFSIVTWYRHIPYSI